MTLNLAEWIRQRQFVGNCAHPCAPESCVCDEPAALRRAELLEKLREVDAEMEAHSPEWASMTDDEQKEYIRQYDELHNRKLEILAELSKEV